MVDPSARRAKQGYYAQPAVVDRYDAWRFGSPGGAYVDERELDLVRELLADVPRDARVLDLPVGTGRLARRLLDDGFTAVHGADASAPMLRAAARRCGPALRLGRHDAFATGFAPASFGAVISLRFVFHHADPAPLLAELARLAAPGACVVFDTLRWSPRAFWPPLQRRLGGLVSVLRDDEVLRLAAACGLEIVERRRILLGPSLAYRFLPSPLVAVIDRAERLLPDALRSKTVWKARRLGA